MKFAVVSDTHLGFGAGTRRQSDAFDQARQAMEMAIERGVDFILLPGDLFDHAVPTPEVWHQAFDLFSLALKAPTANVCVRKEEKEIKFTGIPLIAIHGTHEFRSKDYKNAIEIMDTAGFMVHVHANRAFIEKNGERVCVSGIGGVPEKKARDVFAHVDAKPAPECFNIFTLHQSLTEYLPADDEMSATLSLADLPKGFDLWINGHLHWQDVRQVGDGTFVLPGSTVCTQAKSGEAGHPKSVFFYDTQTRTHEFAPIATQRVVHYCKERFTQAEPAQVTAFVEKKIQEFLEADNGSLEPVIRVKCVGTLAKGFLPSDVSLAPLAQKYEDRAILSLDRVFDATDFKKRIEDLREMAEAQKSVSEMGVALLEQKLAEAGIAGLDTHRLFELLLAGDTERAAQVLREKN